MYHIILFDLVTEITSKDSTGQTKKIETIKSVIGKQKSVYQNEFYQADQAGIRPQGVLEISSFDYSGEKLLKINNVNYPIYRTYEVGTDKIELYYGERVGAN